MRARKIKVKVNLNIQDIYSGYIFRGQEIFVTPVGASGLYKLPDNKGYIAIEDFEIMEETFTPKSGMTFKTSRGQYGLFIQTDEGLHMLFDSGDGYTGHTSFNPKMLGNNADFTEIVEIYKGMNEYKHYGQNGYIQGSVSTGVVWSRTSNKVELNGDYTAEINGDIVKVGCQEIPIEKVREILDLHEKLKG